MSTKIRVIAALLVVLVFQMSKPAPARAANAGEIALYVGIGVVVLGGVIYLGTRLTYPEAIHMLVPGAGNIPPTNGPPARVHFGPQCQSTRDPLAADSVPLLCW